MDMGNAERKTIWSVDYTWVDARVRQYLGFPDYEFLVAQESGNDQSHDFSVGPWSQTDSLETWQQEVEEDFRVNVVEYERMYNQPNWMYSTSTLLDVLCARSIIEPGEYIVKVSY